MKICQNTAISKLQPGQILGADVIADSHVLLNEGTVLTEDIIWKLMAWKDVDKVSVTAYNHDYSEKLPQVDQDMLEKYGKTVTSVRNAFETARQFKSVPVDDLVSVAHSMVENLVSHYAVLQTLKLQERLGEYTFQHSVNVGILAGIIGKWLKFDAEHLSELVLAGVLHDIGKAQIPPSILDKPGRLTKEECLVMRKHTIYGYDLLKDLPDVSETIRFAVLQHHERLDGSGYPFRLSGDKINDISKIISVADTYDAMTSERVYQSKRTPFAAVEVLEQDMFIRMDATVCLAVLNHLKESLVGNQVMLRDGRSAKIIQIGRLGADDLVVQTDDGEFINIGLRQHGLIASCEG